MQQETQKIKHTQRNCPLKRQRQHQKCNGWFTPKKKWEPQCVKPTTQPKGEESYKGYTSSTNTTIAHFYTHAHAHTHAHTCTHTLSLSHTLTHSHTRIKSTNTQTKIYIHTQIIHIHTQTCDKESLIRTETDVHARKSIGEAGIVCQGFVKSSYIPHCTTTDIP